jgi:hypothetical protein
MGHAVGDQSGDGGPARVVGVEDLPEEHPEGDERGEDPVQPGADGSQRVRDDLVGEDVGERQPAVLEELVPQEARLLAKRPGVRLAHGSGLRTGEEGLPNPIFAQERPAAYLFGASGFAEL